MGRPCKAIDGDNRFLCVLAAQLRTMLSEKGMTFQELSDNSEGISRITFQRAASGKHMPKEKTIIAFATACNRLDEAPLLLHLRVQARVLERGKLKELSAPRPELIGDRRDLSMALELLYEAAGAPTIRDIQIRSQEPHALPTSTIRRIIRRDTTPVDLRQLLGFIRGCGYENQEKVWTEVWTKISQQSVSAPVAVPVQEPAPAPVRAAEPRQAVVKRRTEIKPSLSTRGRRLPTVTSVPPRNRKARHRKSVEPEVGVAAAAGIGAVLGGLAAAGYLALAPS